MKIHFYDCILESDRYDENNPFEDLTEHYVEDFFFLLELKQDLKIIYNIKSYDRCIRLYKLCKKIKMTKHHFYEIVNHIMKEKVTIDYCVSKLTISGDKFLKNPELTVNFPILNNYETTVHVCKLYMNTISYKSHNFYNNELSYSINIDRDEIIMLFDILNKFDYMNIRYDVHEIYTQKCRDQISYEKIGKIIKPDNGRWFVNHKNSYFSHKRIIQNMLLCGYFFDNECSLNNLVLDVFKVIYKLIS